MRARDRLRSALARETIEQIHAVGRNRGSRCVRNELLNVPGVLAADVRYGTSDAVVRFDPVHRPADESLISAVGRTGYTSSLMTPRELGKTAPVN
jgi:hypothetical protein